MLSSLTLQTPRKVARSATVIATRELRRECEAAAASSLLNRVERVDFHAAKLSSVARLAALRLLAFSSANN